MKIDIIIPAYNAKKTIRNTLDSIKMQTNISDCNIYIINDCSDYDYSQEVSDYSNYMNIKEISTGNNIGPGGARRIGIINSSNPYLVFIDSDDVFYEPDNIASMAYLMDKNNSDILISDFIYERDNKRVIKKMNPVWLHGKMYRRSFLEKNNINFNDSRANEDNGFNTLCFLLNPSMTNYDHITYIYCENPDSITRRDNRSYKFHGIEGYVYNIDWAINNAIVRNADVNRIRNILVSVLVILYFYYMEFYNQYDVSKIIEWSKPLIKHYNKYHDIISYELIEINIKDRKEIYRQEETNYDEVLSFDEFINKINSEE